MKKIDLVAIDDADVVTTTKLIIGNILKPLKGQIVMFSTAYNASSLKHIDCEIKQIVSRSAQIPLNINQYFMKCADIKQKYNALIEILQKLKRSTHFVYKVIVFCNVSFSANFADLNRFHVQRIVNDVFVSIFYIGACHRQLAGERDDKKSVSCISCDRRDVNFPAPKKFQPIP